MGGGRLIPQPLSRHWPLKCDMCVVYHTHWQFALQSLSYILPPFKPEIQNYISCFTAKSSPSKEEYGTYIKLGDNG